MKFLIYFLLTGFSGIVSLSAQDINMLDVNGKRHGIWQKKYEGTDQMRYEGTFDHGQEIGTFKFYCEDCKKVPMAVKEFEVGSDKADVKYFTPKGTLVSQGKMEGKNRVGEWLYFHKNSSKVMTTEFYKNGKLNGQKTTFYLNDRIAEKTNYVDGLKEGSKKCYSPEGVLLKTFQYENDTLSGAAAYYDSNGTVSIQGNYKNGKKNGLWKYYKQGKVVREETYPKPSNKTKN
jgi:antitoxin component YwqK of YwqJK toxin-antitoxin module